MDVEENAEALSASMWMLREGEPERLDTTDVKVEGKLVFLCLVNSKMDIAAEGTLKASCGAGDQAPRSQRLCPKRVSLELSQ